MNKIIGYLNLVGVLALMGLCVVQWGVNSRLDGVDRQLSKSLEEQIDKVADQEKTLKQDATDLEDVRQRLAISEGALRDCQAKAAAAVAQGNAVTAQRDQLKADLDKCTAAVAARDDALKQANEQVQRLAGERDDAVKRFNDLAEKYNALSKGGK
jgi:chromosome segregation ATPase